MMSNELMTQLDIQNLARRAFVAVHGSCYGFVTVIKRDNNVNPVTGEFMNEFCVVGVSGDVRFGENAKAGHVVYFLLR